MGKKVKITEEQMRLLNELYLGEDSTDTTKPNVVPVTDATGKPNVEKTQKQITKAAGPANAGNFNIPISGSEQGNKTNQVNNVNCSVVITKKQLSEYQMRQLKRNSNLYTVKDFIKNA